jgi:hypothetical protein
MFELKLIAPQLPENVDAVTIAQTFQHIRREFCKICGGYTEVDGQGGWVDAEGNLIVDQVTVFTGAVLEEHKTAIADPALQGLAMYVRERLKQDCVYIRYSTGKVELV